MINTQTGEVFDIIVKNDEGNLVVAKQACDMIESFERQMKEISKQYGEYKAALKEAMEEYGVEKIDTDAFVVNYVDAHDRITVDSKRLQTEAPDIYNKYSKVSSVKASVRVRLR